MKNKDINVILTDRDIKLFHDIYNYRFLTLNQIHRVYFPHSYSYCRRRLSQLKQAGYLASEPYVKKNGFKRGSCYFITDRGISKLGLQKSRQAFTNRIEYWQVPYFAKQNELFLTLRSYGWECWESREVKEKYSLNRNSYIRGLLKKNNINYGLYIIPENPTDTTLKYIKKNISEHSRDHLISRNIVLCLSSQSIEDFGQDLCYSSELHLLSYPSFDRIIALGVFKDIVESKLKGTAKLVPESYAYYLIKHHEQGKENYIAQYFTNDIVLQSRISDYSYNKAKSYQKGLVVYTWEGQHTPSHCEIFHSSPHVYERSIDNSLVEQFTGRSMREVSDNV